MPRFDGVLALHTRRLGCELVVLNHCLVGPERMIFGDQVTLCYVV